MKMTLLAMAMALAMSGMATAHTTAKPHSHPHPDAEVTILADAETDACAGGVSVDDMREAAMEAGQNLIVLEGVTLDAFAAAVMDKYNVAKPDDIKKIVIPDFYALSSDPVIIAHFDEAGCMTAQSAWDRAFMQSVFKEADFAAAKP